MSVKGKTLNMSQVAELFGVTRRAVEKWVENGLPHLRRDEGHKGEPWQFNSLAVIKWYAAHRTHRVPAGQSATISESRRRKAAADAALAEIQLDTVRGKLIPHVEIEKAWTGIATALRSRLLAIPQKLAPIVAAEPDPAKNRLFLQEEIHEALDELSKKTH